MGLFRLFILAVIGYCAYALWRKYQQHQRLQQRPTTQVTDTVRCAYCNTHSPKQTAVYANGKWYCNEQHQKLSQQ
ncbi:PP0621 family protein [Pseudomonas sp. F1_0610]|uniref:PP0621 family protein n=1 Tax=Pseudomonas sp. F1_0610 TaxID=3114284 RepID=UPI0039C26142